MKNYRFSVVLDLKTHRSVWEDFCDVLRAKEREDEPRESIDSVKKKVLKRAWLPGYTITFARSARKELQSLPMDVAADKTLSALSPTVPTSTPGNREKLSDRINRIVQDLFFFRKTLMKNM